MIAPLETAAIAHPYLAVYLIAAAGVTILALLIGAFRARRRTDPPSVSTMLARADANIADFAKTGRLRGPGGRFISTKDAR